MHVEIADHDENQNPYPSKIGNVIYALAKGMAIFGSAIFMILVVMTLVSIVGRKLFAWTVPGDVEVLQMSAAFACSSFFAYGHLTNSDVKVDFFTNNLSLKYRCYLDALGSLTVALFAALLTWRTWLGAWNLKEVGETSPILDWPVWVAQVLMTPGFLLMSIVGLYVCTQQIKKAQGDSK